MNILLDHNLRGHSVMLAGSLVTSGWLDLISIRFVLFEEVGLEVNSSDRDVWNCAQANEMILLTANRSMKGKDSQLTSNARGKYPNLAPRYYDRKHRSLACRPTVSASLP